MAESVVAERGQLDLLLHRLVDDLGDLHLGHLGLGNSDGGVASVGVVGVGVASVAQGQAGVGQHGSRGGLGGLVSGPLASGLALSQAGNGEPENVGAAGLLDSVGDVLHRDLHLLDDGLDDVRGVGEGAAQGVGVAEELSRGGRNQDRTHQLGMRLSCYNRSADLTELIVTRVFIFSMS